MKHLSIKNTFVYYLGFTILIISVLMPGLLYAESDLLSCEKFIDSFKMHQAKSCIKKYDKDSSFKNSAELFYLKGKYSFYSGDFDKAEELTGRALELKNGELDWQYMIDQIRISKNRVQKMEKAVYKKSSVRFLYMDSDDRILLKYALSTLSKQKRRLQEMFEESLDNITVYILPSVEMLSDMSGLTVEQIETTGTVAITRFNRIMILSPKAVLSGYPWRDTLAHELTHVAIYKRSNNLSPIWLHEGIAKYLETLWSTGTPNTLSSESSYLLGNAARHNTLIPLRRFYPSVSHLENQEDAALAYAEGLDFIIYLQSKFKEKKSVKDLLHLIGIGESLDNAFVEATGYKLKKLVLWWKQRLNGMWSNPDTDFSINILRYKKENISQLSMFEKNLSIDVRQHIRTGDLLQLRGHLKAAKQEYQWAYDKSKIPPAQVVSRLSSVLIALSKNEEALKLLDEAKIINPYNSTLYVLSAKSAYNLGNKKLAKKRLLHAIGLEPFNPDIHCLLAKVYKPDSRQSKEERDICLTLGAEKE